MTDAFYEPRNTSQHHVAPAPPFDIRIHMAHPKARGLLNK
jgi:hypothetical protein